MPANTADQQITYPVDLDSADAPVAFLASIADIEPRLVREYTNEADRTARMLDLTSGDISTLITPTIGSARTEVYNGTNHISLFSRGLYALARKNADEVINNSVTLQNDNDLLAALPTAGTFMFDLDLVYSATTVADIKITLTWPAGATATWTAIGPATGNTGSSGDANFGAVTASGTTAVFGGIGAATFLPLRVSGEITMGGTAGNLQLQWAQQNLEATNTTMWATSRMKVWRAL